MSNSELPSGLAGLTRLARRCEIWDGRPPTSRRLCLLAVVVLSTCATACRRDMQDQPKYKMYRESAFFDDRAAVRPLPEHTVARGFLRDDVPFYTGRTGVKTNAGGSAASASGGVAGNASAAATQGAAGAANFEPDLVTAFPFPVTREVLDRGQNEYRTFCIECHGPTGEGDGVIVRRGYRKPTSYHDERLRAAPVGHFFDVMTNGWGAMPSYSYLVPPRDRWAIAAYIRALQLSRSAKLADLPPAEQQRLASLVPPQPAPSPSPTPTQTPRATGETPR